MKKCIRCSYWTISSSKFWNLVIFIDLQLASLCFHLRKAFFLMHSVRCFCWLIKFIRIILETPTPFTYFLLEQISDSLQYVSKDPNCLILSIQKFRMLTVFLNWSLNLKLSSWTDFPLFCLFVCILAF